ncbi:hypothetical protein KAU39_06440 [bacterium]|nr:hypothetical protein [bacterium]
MFKRLMVFLLGCFLVAGVGITSVYAEGEGVLIGSAFEVSSDVAINSKYVWRGFLLDDDPVMQSGLYVSAYGFSASVWGSFDMDSEDTCFSDEVDYSIDYTYSADKFSLSVGHIYYDFPIGDGFSKEIYFGGGLSVLLSPSLTWYQDYSEEDSGGGDGSYIVLALCHSLALGEGPITLDLSGHIGSNQELFIAGDGGDVALGASLGVPLSDKCSFTPSINYSMPFGDLEDEADGNQEAEFYGGLVVAFSM